MPVIKLEVTNSKIHDTDIYSGGNNANANALVTQGDARELYMKFELGLIPNNAIINSASLRLLSNGANTVSYLSAHKVLEDWTETDISWDTKPTYEATPATTIVPPTVANFPFEMDVTELAQSWVDGEGFGLVLKAPLYYSIIASNHSTASYRPYLTIDYTIPTEDKKQVKFIETVGQQVNGAAVTTTIPIPAGRIADDLILVLITAHRLPAIPQGWESLGAHVLNETAGMYSAAFYKFSDGTETDVTVTSSDGYSINWTYSVQIYRNVKNVHNHGMRVNAAGGRAYAPVPTDLEPGRLLVLLTTSSYSQDMTPPLNFAETGDYRGLGANRILQTSRGYNHSKTVYTEDELATMAYYSNYLTAAQLISLEPVLNEAPHIDGQDEDLGATATPIQKAYMVADTEGDAVTVVEKLDGVTINTRSGAGTYTLDLSAQWENLSLGKHTITIEANDDYANPPHEPRVRTWTFFKLLAPKSKPGQIIAGIGDIVTKFEGLKQMLVDKVGGDPAAKFEDVINNFELGKKYVIGQITSAASTLSIPNQAGTTSSLNYVAFDLSMLDFIPSRINFVRADKLALSITDWYKDNFYVSGANYANVAHSSGAYRAPYANGIVNIPVNTANMTFDWIAIE